MAFRSISYPEPSSANMIVSSASEPSRSSVRDRDFLGHGPGR